MDNWIIPNDNFWRFNRARLIFWPFEWPKPTIFDDGIGSNIFLYEDLCSVWPDCDVFQQMQAKLWAILKTSIFKCGYCLGNFEKHLYNILFQHLEHLIIKLLYSVSLELFFWNFKFRPNFIIWPIFQLTFITYFAIGRSFVALLTVKY